MPWYSSWIPDLPNINFGIPGIQGRFVSFVLKKSLGHLLKPGQLDSHQIDSQIGSGYVQINNLELNPEVCLSQMFYNFVLTSLFKAINSYFHALPIAFHDGTISSVKARIPWPNPLASTLGFSLTSLNLVFHVVPSPSPASNFDVDLTASVASAAESFIHEELSPREAVALWQTLHRTTPSPTDIEEQAIPGGLDNIIATDDDCHKVDVDPEGVSIFATLLERLLARFEFDAQDLTVTLIHPGNMTLTLTLEEIRYHTVSKDTNLSSARRESRTLSIHGCHLTARNLDSRMPLTFSPSAPTSTISVSPSTSRPLSHTSSSSSIDEETQFTMSQSLAFLPPKTNPLSTSTSSSMYQSALSSSSRSFLDPLDKISEAATEANLVPSSPLRVPVSTTQKDHRLLSFGSLPIDIQVTTPSPVANPSSDDPFLPHAEEIYSDEILQVAVSMGVIACAFRPWDIHGLLQLVQSLDGSHQMASKADTEPLEKSFTIYNMPLKIHTQLRGIVLLLLPSPRSASSSMTDGVEAFFDRCLVPLSFDCGYTRIHLDGLTASLACSSHQKQDCDAPKSPTSNAAIDSSFEFAITDMSIFLFSKPSFDNKSSLSAFPLLLTDPHLATQYSTSHIHPQGNGSYIHLPRFDIIDWTDEKCQSFGTRLSAWRVRLPKHGAYQYSSSLLKLHCFRRLYDLASRAPRYPVIPPLVCQFWQRIRVSKQRRATSSYFCNPYSP